MDNRTIIDCSDFIKNTQPVSKSKQHFCFGNITRTDLRRIVGTGDILYVLSDSNSYHRVLVNIHSLVSNYPKSKRFYLLCRIVCTSVDVNTHRTREAAFSSYADSLRLQFKEMQSRL